MLEPEPPPELSGKQYVFTTTTANAAAKAVEAGTCDRLTDYLWVRQVVPPIQSCTDNCVVAPAGWKIKVEVTNEPKPTETTLDIAKPAPLELCNNVTGGPNGTDRFCTPGATEPTSTTPAAPGETRHERVVMGGN